MKIFFNRHAIILAALLQVMPIVRNFFTNPAVASNFAIIFRWGVGAAAAFESVDAVSGASPSFALPTNFVATAGVSFSNSMVVSLVGTGNNASTSDGFILTNLLNKADRSAFFSNGQSTTNAVPPGLTCTCISLKGASFIYGSFTGTPTTPGSYAFSATCLSPGNGSVTAKIFFTVSGTLSPPPDIVSQPAGTTILSGSNATFSVVAGGTGPLSYQWYFNTNTVIANATNSTLTLTNVQPGNGGYYRVVVSNAGGSTNSANAPLTVLQPPVITAQPTNTAVAAGGNVSFTVTATGTAPLFFQWRKNNSALPGSGTISGVNSNKLTISNVTTNDAAIYSVIVTNSVGSVTSLNASLNVEIPPTVTAQPTGISGLAGTNVSFTVSATGTAPLNYQWRKNNSPLVNGGNVSGATSSALNISIITAGDGGIYSVVVSNAVGVATSSNATLTVFSPPAFAQQAASRTITVGSTTIFSATVSGTTPLIYQWSKDNSPLIDGGNVSGATSNILTISNLSTNDSGNYSLIVTNSYGSASSSNATLTVVTAPVPPTILVQPTNQSVVAGNSISFSVLATGTAPLNYQWRKNNSPLANGGTISGANSDALTISTTTTNDATNYSVVVTNIAGAVTSSIAALIVFTPPAFVAQATSRSLSVGATTVFLATVIGTGPLIYQWSKDNMPLADGGNISGAMSNVLTIANVTTNDAGNYSLTATNLYGVATSSNALLAISTASGPPVIVVPPTNQTAAVGDTVSFSVVAMGTEPLRYQWRKGNNKIKGATNSALVLVNVKNSNNGSYSVVVANDGGSITSPKATLKILTPPAVTHQANNRSVKVGKRTVFKTHVSGSSPMAFQWFKDGVALTNDGNFSGVFTHNLSVFADGTNETGVYWLTATNAVGGTTSSNVVLTVLLPPTIETQPQDQTVRTGRHATFFIVATGTGPLDYQWRKNGKSVAGATNSSLFISSVQTSDAGTYSVVVKNSAGSATSSDAVLTITAGESDNVQNQTTVTKNVITTNEPVMLLADPPVNGAVTIYFTGQPGAGYTVEASSDLSSWSEIYSTNAPADGYCEMTDTNVAAHPARFYRVRSP